MRLRILQSYINDLSEQNEVLVQTVEELEKEANDRVALLENKLQKTANSVKVGLSQSFGKIVRFSAHIYAHWWIYGNLPQCSGSLTELQYLHTIMQKIMAKI